MSDPSHDHRGESDQREQTGEAERLLVLDSHKNAALVFARALSDQDVDITAGGWSKLSPAMLSRHTSGRFLYPSPYEQPDAFIAELTTFLRRTDHFAVIPMSDLTHVLLSKHKRKIESTGTMVGAEDWKRLTRANNKKTVAELANTLSIPVPETNSPESIAEVRSIASELSYPVVLKPQYTTVMTADGNYTEARIADENYVDRPADLVPRYRSLLNEHDSFATDPPIIQECVPGSVVATCGVSADGEFLGYFQEERLRMYPVNGGSSSLRRGICEPKMAEYARRIVAELEWTGPIYIEFIQTPDDEFYILEVNGRYWGSVGCAVRGGVNVPLLHYQQLSGVEPASPEQYETGHHQRRLFYTDFQWLGAQLRSGNVAMLAAFVRSFFEADHDVLSASDPVPTAGAVLWAARELLRKEGPRRPEKSQASGLRAQLTRYL